MHGTDETARRLLDSSARLSRDPETEIDWEAPLGDGYGLSPEWSTLYGTAYWDELSESQRRELTRHEAASVASTGIWFELILQQLILRDVYAVNPAGAEFQWALTEIAHECRHSIMFARATGRPLGWAEPAVGSSRCPRGQRNHRSGDRWSPGPRGRRAYSGSAFRDLLTLDGVEVVVDQSDLANTSVLRAERLEVAGKRSPELRGPQLELSSPPQPGRRIVLRFDTTSVAWDPEVGLTTDGRANSAGNLFSAIGFAGRPVAGSLFDERRAIVPNVRGAVDGRPAHYVTGWIKRGARGGIGANEACAQETVRTLLATGATTLM